jgi:hypothetical protein
MRIELSGSSLKFREEVGVAPIAIVTALCAAAAIAFYVRFLIALCTECKPGLIGYWVRLRLGSGEKEIIQLEKREKPVSRAA